MRNEQLVCRHGSRLNDFTRALRDECKAKSSVLVQMRNGDWRLVQYAEPDAEHPWDDCPDGGFRSEDHSHYWLANGESVTGDRFDLVEFESKEVSTVVPRAELSFDAETLTRLRRVLRLLGLENAVPEDDRSLAGALFPVLGQVAAAVERLKSTDAGGAVTSPLSDTGDRVVNAVVEYIASQWEGCTYDNLEVDREIRNAGSAFLRSQKKG
jgi:hypothetical protein